MPDMPQIPTRIIGCVAGDKGGVGKSTFAAELFGVINHPDSPWTLVEIEQRPTFTQSYYQRSNKEVLHMIALLEESPSGTTNLSLNPLGNLHAFIPSDPKANSRVLIDYGASSFNSFTLWATSHNGLNPFLTAGYKFIFFIVLNDGDHETAAFYNQMAPILAEIGTVVPVWNTREGDTFSFVDKALSSTPGIILPYAGKPLTTEIARGNHRMTFKNLAIDPNVSRRTRIDAALCAEKFEASLTILRSAIPLIDSTMQSSSETIIHANNIESKADAALIRLAEKAAASPSADPQELVRTAGITNTFDQNLALALIAAIRAGTPPPPQPPPMPKIPSMRPYAIAIAGLAASTALLVGGYFSKSSEADTFASQAKALQQQIAQQTVQFQTTAQRSAENVSLNQADQAKAFSQQIGAQTKTIEQLYAQIADLKAELAALKAASANTPATDKP